MNHFGRSNRRCWFVCKLVEMEGELVPDAAGYGKNAVRDVAREENDVPLGVGMHDGEELSVFHDVFPHLELVQLVPVRHVPAPETSTRTGEKECGP